ncbi:MAG: hypothetical protein WCP30_00990 [Mycobacteriaceae bacterium]
MSTDAFVGRVGGLAVALGVGVAIAHGAAVASADRGADSSSASATSSHSDSAAGPKRTARQAVVARSAAATRPARGGSGSASAQSNATHASAAAAVATPSASAVAPDPKATVTTQYGEVGKWMVNKAGNVADWAGLPYCTGDTCKTLQEPINTIITVKANSKFMAEAKLNFTLRRAGFPPSCCSSVGFQGIVDQLSQQMPRGGILGVGVLGPGTIQSGLLGLLAGIGPAYRDASFLLVNSHLRTFGGVPDGNGDYVFTASVSKEYLTKDPTTGKTTHGYESFDRARAKLLAGMAKAGATDQGMVELCNEIPAADPKYSTGDHDGLAQVIAISGMAALAWRAPNPG